MALISVKAFLSVIALLTTRTLLQVNQIPSLNTESNNFFSSKHPGHINCIQVKVDIYRISITKCPIRLLIVWDLIKLKFPCFKSVILTSYFYNKEYIIFCFFSCFIKFKCTSFHPSIHYQYRPFYARWGSWCLSPAFLFVCFFWGTPIPFCS